MLAPLTAPPNTRRLPNGLLLPSAPCRPAWRAPENLYLPGTRRLRPDALRCLGGPLYRGASPLWLTYGPIVSAGWWLQGGVNPPTVVAAYTAMGAVSQAVSYDNNAAPGNGLADGTYDLTLGVAPTWNAATGWAFNGTTQWLDTGVVPSFGYSMIVRWSSARDATTRGMIGIRNDGTKRFYISPTWGATRFWGYSASQATEVESDVSGVFAITQTAHYLNGTPTAWTPAAFVGDVAIPIGRVTGSGSFYAGSIQSIAIYSVNIDSFEAAIRAAMP